MNHMLEKIISFRAFFVKNWYLYICHGAEKYFTNKDELNAVLGELWKDLDIPTSCPFARSAWYRKETPYDGSWYPAGKEVRIEHLDRTIARLEKEQL